MEGKFIINSRLKLLLPEQFQRIYRIEYFPWHLDVEYFEADNPRNWPDY